ncbi:3-oxo-tetronate kinase [Vibrio maritimus]|uniref:3-oxo-tetronate kinase n=1 Tax=Vibrio maritimus TaxID=990268 RepID=UPI0040689CBA
MINKLGVIADDFTGATDAASFAAKSGLRVVQLSGVPSQDESIDADVLVVSLKSRSCPADIAIKQSLDASHWLLSQGCTQIYFKYCSTFDSTTDGNIGPVTEALMAHLSVNTALICPALPVNGRTVYKGNLFVFDEPLSESGMRHHPITPMTDSNLLRLIESQVNGNAALLDWNTIQQGCNATQLAVEDASIQGATFIVCDALTHKDLDTIAAACESHRLLTGGSGLVGALAQRMTSTSKSVERFSRPKLDRKGVVLSGSCSTMTNQQVDAYKELAASLKLDIERVINEPSYITEVIDWIKEHSNRPYFPLVYATVSANELKQIQADFGSAASAAVEGLFHQLVSQLSQQEYQVFISAGGETSSTVTQALSVDRFEIGAEIAPGVPWVQSLDGQFSLALKSGNFGDKHFFQQAQDQ